MSWRYKIKQALRSRSLLLHGGMAEFLGTFLLVTFGNGCVAQTVLSNQQNGNFFSITVGYGLAVAMGVAVCIGVSGGHVNPAVTLVMAVLGRCRWSAVPVFVLAQYLGAFVGAAAVFGIYYDALNNFDPDRTVVGEKATAGIFATYPQEFVSTWNAFGDQIAGTAFLMISVLAITDRYNSSPQQGMIPILVGLVVTLIGNAFGFNCGYAINPARDFGPRVFTIVAGWGGDVLRYREYNWFWVPIVGPHVGAFVGAFIYQIFVGVHWPEDNAYDFTKRSSPQPRENPLYMTKASLDNAAYEFADVNCSTSL